MEDTKTAQQGIRQFVQSLNPAEKDDFIFFHLEFSLSDGQVEPSAYHVKVAVEMLGNEGNSFSQEKATGLAGAATAYFSQVSGPLSEGAITRKIVQTCQTRRS